MPKGGPNNTAGFADNIRDIRTFFGSNLTHDLRQKVQTAQKSFFPKGSAAAAKLPMKSNASKDNIVAKPKKKIIISSRSSAVLNYKATNIVMELKQRLDKTDMLAVKEALKGYKESKVLEVLVTALRDFVQQSKLSPPDLKGFRDFIRAEDTTAFEDFLIKVMK